MASARVSASCREAGGRLVVASQRTEEARFLGDSLAALLIDAPLGRGSAGRATAEWRWDPAAAEAVAGVSRGRAGFVGVLVLAAALRLYALGDRSFWTDEAATMLLLRADFGDMLEGIPRDEASPPLYYVLGWLWAQVGRDGRGRDAAAARGLRGRPRRRRLRDREARGRRAGGVRRGAPHRGQPAHHLVLAGGAGRTRSTSSSPPSPSSPRRGSSRTRRRDAWERGREQRRSR